MRELTPVSPISLEELATARYRYSSMLRATPDAVFAELGDPSLWSAMLYHSVWKTGATSGVGAEREVSVHGFGTFRERMLAWVPGERIAFTMIGTTSPLVARMAEDLIIEPLEDGVRYHWNVVVTPTLLGRLIQPAIGAILKGLFVRSANNLAKRTVWSAGRLAATHGA
ncbi:MAG: SRPBCC family protein [Kofleriaceae bacterium]